jgi:hypothetical protein
VIFRVQSVVAFVDARFQFDHDSSESCCCGLSVIHLECLCESSQHLSHRQESSSSVQLQTTVLHIPNIPIARLTTSLSLPILSNLGTTTSFSNHTVVKER